MTEPRDHTPSPIAFVDTETTSLDASRLAWEIAVIRREPDGEQTEWCEYVEVDLSAANEFSLKVGRFYDRHPFGRYVATGDQRGLGDALLPTQAAIEVAQRTHGCHVVGAVPNFDTEVLDKLLRSQGLLPAWHYHLIDIENLAVGYLAAKGITVVPPYRSDDLHLALGLEPTPDDERHTALGDARWAMRMYDAVMSGNALRYAVESVGGRLDHAARQRPAVAGDPSQGPYPASVGEVADEVAMWIARTEDESASGLRRAVADRLTRDLSGVSS